jgi:hypothetical protein
MILTTTCGTEFEIDDEDVPLFVGMTFSIRGKYVGTWNGVRQQYLHRIIMPDGECDHMDRNKLNNRKENLRYVTRSQNMQNRETWGMWPKGIMFDDVKQLFRARIQVNGKRISCGRHKNLEDAVAAYNRKAIEHYGEEACLSTME